MRKILAGLGIIFCFIGVSYANPRPTITSTGTYKAMMPGPGTFASGAVYYSSAFCVASNLNNVIISTGPSFLYQISITSKGAGSPIIEAFDARTSTSASTIQRVSSPMNGLTERDYFFEIGMVSGTAVSNQGLTPACLNVIYSDR